MNGKMRGKTIVNVCITLFFAVSVLLPIISMFTRITPASVSGLIHSPQFSAALKNSLLTSLTSTVISMALALAAAWCIERTGVKCKSILKIIFILPMLIPSISHAFGLVTLFGSNGILTNLLRLKSGIYGFAGIVTGSVMYSFPVAFLMFDSILYYEDGLPYRAADVLGISKFNQFTAITLPYLKKTLISVFFAIFTLTITDYGVPLLIGAKTVTLSVLMYNKAVGMLDYGTGSAIGVVLLVPAVAAFLADMLNPDNGQNSFIAEQVQPKKSMGRDIISSVFCVILSICVFLPILAFCVIVLNTKYPINTTLTFAHIQNTLSRGAGRYLVNSLIYSLGTGLLGTAVAFICSYMTSRVKGRFSKGLHLLSLTSMAIPGMVLGLSYVIFFSKSGFYGTMAIIFLVNSIHFFASPYLMMYNTLSKVNENLESVGVCLGVSRIRIIFDVILPKVRHTMFEMFGYFFVNSMMTISAVSFLAPPAPKPVALMINQFEAQLLMESAAFVSLMILAVNLLLKGIVQLAEKRLSREKD